jgi:uncharacterized protein (DUF2147 family)
MPLLLAMALLASDAPIEGRWRSPGGNSIIDIAPCGAELCGTVAWASDKAKQDARKTTDHLVGTQLLTGLEEKKPGRWQGTLFIPDRNMRATARIQLVDPHQLKVSGCFAMVLCSTQIWSRFDDPLPE